jgi:hypothetical protein
MVFQFGRDKLKQPVLYIILKNDDVENDENGKKEKVFYLINLSLNYLYMLMKLV